MLVLQISVTYSVFPFIANSSAKPFTRCKGFRIELASPVMGGSAATYSGVLLVIISCHIVEICLKTYDSGFPKAAHVR